MRNTPTTQKATTCQEAGRNTSSAASKSIQPTATTKRKSEISSNKTSNKSCAQDTLSDISDDEAEESLPSKG